MVDNLTGAEIIDLREQRDLRRERGRVSTGVSVTHMDSLAREEATEPGDAALQTVSSGRAQGAISRETEMDDLYVSDAPNTATLGRARDLLRRNELRLATASAHLASGELIDADYEVTLFQADLPELFCCRSISEGFGVLLVALHHALRNREGNGLNRSQMEAVTGAVKELHSNTFLSFDRALSLVEDIEKSGLLTDPPEAEFVGEMLA